MSAHRSGEVAHRHPSNADALFDRSHATSLDSARDDRIKEAQIGGYVEREAVVCDPAADTDADRGDLSRADPNTGQSGATIRVEAEFSERVDHRLLEVSQVSG